jgi:general secretion pathway protein G
MNTSIVAPPPAHAAPAPAVQAAAVAARARRARRRAAQKGMTLIEILVVVAIIGLIVGGVSVMAFGQFRSAQSDTAQNQVSEVARLVEMYRVQKKGKCPKTLSDLKAAGIANKVAKDPWGNEYTFKCPGEHDDVDVSSPGPDGEVGTADDINSWDEAKAGEEGEAKDEG